MSIDAITPVVPPPVAVAEDEPQSAGTEASTTTNTAVVPDPAELALENLSVNELKADRRVR